GIFKFQAVGCGFNGYSQKNVGCLEGHGPHASPCYMLFLSKGKEGLVLQAVFMPLKAPYVLLRISVEPASNGLESEYAPTMRWFGPNRRSILVVFG
ncbi:MAG: hypothetical protein ACKO8U_06755, partial [Pirellula sp.]